MISFYNRLKEWQRYCLCDYAETGSCYL